jgi:ribosomal protein S18 acetylase RimI-like enzyme
MVVDVSLVPARYDRERHLQLLLEADESEQHMRVYLDRGQLLEIHNAGGMIGVTVLVRDADEVEIWNIALSEGSRGRGLGRAAIGAIAYRCRQDGASRLTVGTSDCSLGTIAFYRKVGFRFAGVRQGYFDRYPVAVVENGIRARDMVMFQMPLAPSSTSNRDNNH